MDKLKIFYIEDHTTFAHYVIHRLLSAYDVVLAASLAEAEALWNAQRPFDLVLLDFHLPDGTGDIWLRRRQSDGEQVTAIAVSSHAQGNTLLCQAGALEVCSKMNIVDLPGLVERALGSRSSL
ncbi:MAG: response regulator, partial [Myxococcota bacterium]